MTQVPDLLPAARRRAQLRYLPGIDGLRAVSVLAVLVYHHYVAELWGPSLGSDPDWLPGGFMGVEVFFVISGYLITSLLLTERRRTGTVSLRHFWMRRARRLLPALFVMLGVTTAVTLLFYDEQVEVLRGDVLAALTYTSNWWQIAAERSYFADLAFLKHLWSLAIEEQFYLLWPPLLALALGRLGRRRTMRLMLLVALFSTLLLAVSRGSNELADPSGAYYATWNRLSGLLLGSLLAFVWAPHMMRGTPGRGARTVLNVAGLVGLYILWWSFRTMHFDELSTFRGGFLLVDLATVIVIAVAAHPSSDWGRILGMRPLAWVGQHSYGIYLWHYPIFAITRPHGLDNTWWPWFVFVARFALTFGVAAASYRFVERPVREGRFFAQLEGVFQYFGVRRVRFAARTAALAVLVAALGVGASLASADPGREEIHGLAEANEDLPGDRPDPAALAKLTSSTTTSAAPTTTAAPDSSATTAAQPDTTAATTPPPPPETTPPPTPAYSSPAVLAIGDSVMLGAKQELETTIGGVLVDAVVSRQFAHAIQVVEAYKAIGMLPPVVVVHLGTNGRWVGPEFDTLMQAIEPSRRVIFLTARMPKEWEGEVNQKLADGVSRHPNANLVDWRQFSGCHADWFANDGFHLTDVGAQNYANFVNAHVLGTVEGLVYC